MKVGENERKGEKGVWANRVKKAAMWRIRDNEWIARVNDEEEEEEKGRKSEVQNIG